ncbi:uncharacterized protein LOC116706135 isoform X2 [Etheostoma spectabile]|uniref:uncharacterized protein LOC116706135 isoform X2 n=1 Tax=Etheostoma spectabile TaxID=54343 RepID=UPI0013AFC359|nr:uncharacterized protein LOC116706135 isoform X2 [Etheostoma spectabile]
MQSFISGYRPLRNKMTVPGKHFYVHLAGETKGAHHTFVEKLKDVGHTEVQSPGESDYLSVFCPISSRVGTDINEALDHIPGGKPAILVVMHHTFDPDHVVAPSRRQVDNPSVLLTVDCLFYERKLLECNRNDIAWHDVQKCLGIPLSQVSTWKQYCRRKCDCDHELSIRLLNSIFKLHTHGQQHRRRYRGCSSPGAPTCARLPVGYIHLKINIAVGAKCHVPRPRTLLLTG